MRIKKKSLQFDHHVEKKNEFWKKVERNFCRNFMWIYLCVTLACFRVKSEIGFSVYIHCISWKATQFNQLIQVRTKIALAKNNQRTRERERWRGWLLWWPTEYNGAAQTIDRIRITNIYESTHDSQYIPHQPQCLSCTVRLKVGRILFLHHHIVPLFHAGRLLWEGIVMRWKDENSNTKIDNRNQWYHYHFDNGLLSGRVIVH